MTTSSVTVVTSSARETERAGEILGRELVRETPMENTVIIAFRGNLGAGKTVFIKGLARGLGARGRVASPTFVLARRHIGKKILLLHVDAYRIGNRREAMLIERAILEAPRSVVAIEWHERVLHIEPNLTVEIQHLGGNRRRITVHG